MKCTCLEIELQIFNAFDFRQNLIIPTVTNQMALVPFEVDMLILRKTNIAIGIEIKVTKQDLKNDLKKPHITAFDRFGKTLALNNYYRKFKHFYYAVPVELQEEALSQIQDFVGLLVYDKANGKFYEAKPPLKISDYKFSEKERYQLARLGAMRVKTAKENILKLTNKLKN